MPDIGIADKTTLDSVNTKVGATGDVANASGSIFARLADLLTNRLTAARAAFLDVAISSRAPASTALSTATWTVARAAALDLLSGIAAQSKVLAASNTVQSSALTERATSGYLGTSLKKFLIPYGGVVRVKFELKVDTTGTANARVESVDALSIDSNNYIASVPLSTTSLVYVPQSVDVPVKPMSIIIIGASSSGSTTVAYVRNAQICYDFTTAIQIPIVSVD